MKTTFIADSADELAQWLSDTIEASEVVLAAQGNQVKLYIRPPTWGQSYDGFFFLYRNIDIEEFKKAVEKVNSAEETILLVLNNNRGK